MLEPDNTNSTQFPKLADVLPQGMTIADLAEVLFCSSLQPSQQVDDDTVQAAVSQSLVNHHGIVAQCAEELAESYGKDPDVACARMRWCRDLAGRFVGNTPAFS